MWRSCGGVGVGGDSGGDSDGGSDGGEWMVGGCVPMLVSAKI